MTSVSYNIEVAKGTVLPRQAGLAPVADPQQWHDPLFDRVGSALNRSPWLAAAGAVGGVVAGAGLAKLAGAGGLLKPLVGGIAGALAGVAATTGIAGALGGNRHAPPAGHDKLPVPDPGAPRERAEQVRVMTWNVHGGMGDSSAGFGTSDRQLDALAEVVRREQPDVLLVQELDDFSTRSQYTAQLDQLARRLNPDSAVAAGPNTHLTGREQNSAILTFNGFTVDNARNIVHEDPLGGAPVRRAKGWVNELRQGFAKWRGQPAPKFTTPDYQPRATLDSMVVTPGGSSVRVLTGHYNGRNWAGGKFDYPELQQFPFFGQLGAWTGPTLLGGDFNVRSANSYGERERTLLAAAGMTDAFSATGVPPGDARRRSLPSGSDIDRVYTSDEFTVESARSVPTDASDHYAVVADVTLTASS